jgi:hypothetical protein
MEPTEAVTPETGWEAQPDLTPREVFLQMMRESVNTLTVVADCLEKPNMCRRVADRDELRRRLAGVIARCETVRLALGKGGA